MTVKLGVLALLEAKSDKGPNLETLLKSARASAVAEEGTVTWYAFKVSETEFGIFDSFEDDPSREAHLSGEIAKALAQNAPELLAKDPDIRMIDIVAVK